jgi:hypothetical protein
MRDLPLSVCPMIPDESDFHWGVRELLGQPGWTKNGRKLVHYTGLWLEMVDDNDTIYYGVGDTTLGRMENSAGIEALMREAFGNTESTERDRIHVAVKLAAGERPEPDVEEYEEEDLEWSSADYEEDCFSSKPNKKRRGWGATRF